MGYFNVSVDSLIGADSQSAKSTMFFCARCHGSCQVCGNSSIYCQTCADGFTPVNGTCVSTNIQLRLIEGPTTQYVKESEGRGARAKDIPDEEYQLYSASHWVFGIGASLMAGLFVVVIIQVRSRMTTSYSPVPLSVPDEDREIGVGKSFPLLSSDLDNEEYSDNFRPKV